jgi:hypothetical protein
LGFGLVLRDGSHGSVEEAREARRLRRRIKRKTMPMRRAIPTVPPAAVPAIAVVLNVGAAVAVAVG